MPTSLDGATLLARFDGIRRFARGGRRAPHKPLLLLYALARLKHDRQTEVRFNAAEAVLRPLIRSYGPWGTEPRLSYPFSRLINDRLWRLPDAETLVDAKGNVWEMLARERDAVAGFTPDVLAAFARLVSSARVLKDSSPFGVRVVLTSQSSLTMGAGEGSGSVTARLEGGRPAGAPPRLGRAVERRRRGPGSRGLSKAELRVRLRLRRTRYEEAERVGTSSPPPRGVRPIRPYGDAPPSAAPRRRPPRGAPGGTDLSA